MASEIIERAARALFPGFLPWDQAGENDKAHYIDIAKAAIKAMREPTEAMLTAGLLHGFVKESGLDVYPSRLWKAMIDAALKE